MSTVETGRRAETAAAEWLQAKGFRIIERNWRTRWCEIDIVAEKEGRLHFIEVKYRKNINFGSGFDAINADKLNRLHRSATAWLHYYSAINAAFSIDVIAISGSLSNPKIEHVCISD